MVIWTSIQLLLLIAECCTHSKGAVTIIPFPRAAVCIVGNEVEVTCNTTDNFLTWSLTFIETTDRITRTLSSTIVNPEIVVINSTIIFTFSRTSELGSTPLVSKLVINSVSQSLNGTKIACMEVGASATMATTTVHIIGDGHDYLSPLEVNVSSEQFGTNGVLVVLDWILDNALMNTNVSSVPIIDTTINVTSAELIIPYNSPTNVSIVATLCGMYNATVIGLNYAKCGPPLISDDSGIIVTGYGDLALEGTNITFNCSSDFSLIKSGVTISRCTNTGQWEPDPRDFKCKEIPDCGPPKTPPDGYILPYTSTLEGARVIFACRNSSQTLKSPQREPEYSAVCYSNGNWEPDPTEICYRNTDNPDVLIIAIATSVCSFLLVSCLMFIIGFTCGHCYTKNCKHTAKEDSCEKSLQPGYPNINSVYEDPDVARMRYQNHDPQLLQENEAYAPLQFQPHRT